MGRKEPGSRHFKTGSEHRTPIYNQARQIVTENGLKKTGKPAFQDQQ
jgi:hypothetical protein